MTQQYDVILVGAGVVGSFIARALSRYALSVLWIDKASDVGEGTSKANTAIVHAGYDAQPGALKARLNVAGNAMYDRVCAELSVEFERCGTYVVGLQSQDGAALDELQQRGQRNGVTGLRRLSADEMRRREPAISPKAIGALFAETGGIVDPFGLCIGASENAVMNGTDLRLETEALSFLREGDAIRGVVTDRGTYRGRWTIIAAGLCSDVLLHRAGLDGFPQKPRKGEYFVLDRVAADTVRGVLFPCPTPTSKGILVTRTVHGNVMLGPNAQQVASRSDASTTATGLGEIMEGALKLVPSLDVRQIIRSFAGLRASGGDGDFMISLPKGVPGLLALAAIDSPGLTAAPAIGEYVVQMLGEAGLRLCPKSDYNPTRQGIPRFAKLSRKQQQALIERDPRYGRIVCRCETVTEGEIVAACHAPIPARSYDALKRRTRLGTGRCQGSFDLPLVIRIMARELDCSPLEVRKSGPGTEFLCRQTKENDTLEPPP